MVDLCETMEQVLQVSGAMDDLPLEMLAAVLCRVQQKDRLRICSLVCKLWRKAANLATSGSLSCQADSRTLSSLSMWLRSNAYASRILQLTGRNTGGTEPTGAVLQLPADMLRCLQSLQLSHCTLEVTKEADSTVTCTTDLAPTITSSVGTTPECTTAAPQAPHQTTISALTALTSLFLARTHISLSDLGSCTGLQHLWLLGVEHLEPGSSSGPGPAAQSSGVGPSPQEALPATYAETAGDAVQVEGAAAADEDLWRGEEEVTPMQKYCVRCLPPQLTAALPQLTQLTSLGLYYSQSFLSNTQLKDPVGASLSSLQQLKRLEIDIWDLKGLKVTQLPTNLTSLELSCVPAVTARTMPGLQQLQQLEELRFRHVHEICPVLLASLTQLTCLDLSGSPFQSTIAVQQLMAALQHLQKLKRLHLFCSLKEQAAFPDVYSALTASSELASLQIQDCTLTPGAIDYIFAATGGPKALKTLFADTGLFRAPGSFERMSACCPALQSLNITPSSMGHYARSLGDWQGFSTVTCLSELTALHLHAVEMPVDALSSIAACTQLKELGFQITAPWTPGSKVRRSINQLTQLAGLTFLSVSGRHHDAIGYPLYYKLMFKDPEGADIYQQLEEAIDSWSACN